MALEFKKVLAKPLVASEDMTAEMAGETVEIITAAVDKFLSTENYEKAAQAVKDGMDRKFGPTWHCCIGEGFGYDVTYNTRNMLLLYVRGAGRDSGRRGRTRTRRAGRARARALALVLARLRALSLSRPLVASPRRSLALVLVLARSRAPPQYGEKLGILVFKC
jgi:dynein light chain 4